MTNEEQANEFVKDLDYVVSELALDYIANSTTGDYRHIGSTTTFIIQLIPRSHSLLPKTVCYLHDTRKASEIFYQDLTSAIHGLLTNETTYLRRRKMVNLLMPRHVTPPV